MLRVHAAAGLLVQEVRAAKTYPDFGMTAESNQPGLRMGRAAAPALQWLGSVGVGGWRGDCHQSIVFLCVLASGSAGE